MSKPRPYLMRDPATIPVYARSLVKRAEALGIPVEARSPRDDLDTVYVGGISHELGIAFVAQWTATGAKPVRWWQRVEWGYVKVKADVQRATGQGLSRTERPTGYSSGFRLVYAGGPQHPVLITYTELINRLKALG